MTEARLPDELDEQAAFYALGLLDEGDRKAFLVKLQGESRLQRHAAAYQAVADALAMAVGPIQPNPMLRERLRGRIERECAREAEQFERTASTVALSAASLTPRDSVRERLLSRIEKDTEAQLAAGHPMRGQEEPQTFSSRPPQFAQAWRHLLVTLYSSLRLSWKAFQYLLRTFPIRSRSPREKTSSGAQLLSKGLTFIRAAEGVWRELAPGVTAKVLSFDLASGKTTALLRIAPGTGYAPHRHTEMEELFVLEGGCLCGGRELKVGDYHRAEAGTEHHETSSDDGCLLLVISSPQNELL